MDSPRAAAIWRPFIRLYRVHNRLVKKTDYIHVPIRVTFQMQFFNRVFRLGRQSETSLWMTN